MISPVTHVVCLSHVSFGALLSLPASLTSAGFCPAATRDPINVHALSSLQPPSSKTVTKEINGLHIHHHYTVRGLWILIEYIKSRRALLCRYRRFHLFLKIEIRLCEPSSRDNSSPQYTQISLQDIVLWQPLRFPSALRGWNTPFVRHSVMINKMLRALHIFGQTKAILRCQGPISHCYSFTEYEIFGTNKRKYSRNWVLTKLECFGRLIFSTF